MRTLVVTLLIASAPTLAPAADEDKAKDAAVGFLKAVKSKDADAVLKTAQVPFLTMVDGSPKVFEKTDELKADLKAKLDTIKDADKVPTEVERVTAYAGLKDRVKDEDRKKAIEKVLGDGTGFAAFVKTPDEKTVVILVRIKDGKAKVVGFGQQ